MPSFVLRRSLVQPKGPFIAETFEVTKTPEEWRKLLTPEQYAVLREADTERAFTSPLNKEKRQGNFVCAGCDLPLFTSEMKYESGTGWPSFFTTIPGVFGLVAAAAGLSAWFGRVEWRHRRRR